MVDNKSPQTILLKEFQGISLVVQWFGVCASTAGGKGSIPG